ncbi:MAG: hypothetical protein HYT47_02715 [Candidatus Vogelbacteria bacterium]|nr:hypothetical protein [Candidatus Vogelbacteria bacterium]
MSRRGFIKTLLLFIIMVAVLTYYKIDLRTLVGVWWGNIRQWLDSVLG